MKKVKPVLLILLSVATGGLFIYSAYTKLFPIQAFENTLVDYGHIPQTFALITARFLIGFEAGLGALIVLHLFGKNKWALKTAFALLVLLSVYLVYLWVTAGNNVNCGCFGDHIWMSPSASLLKNILLLAVIALLIRYHRGLTYKWARITAPLLLLCILISAYCVPAFKPYKMDLTAIYSNKNFAPTAELAKGKHIIAFLSPSCIHCRKAALKMHEMKEKDPTIPFFMVIGGTASDLKDFWAASRATDIPYTRLAQDPFMKYTGGTFPTILWVNNGLAEASTTYPELNFTVIEKWLKEN